MGAARRGQRPAADRRPVTVRVITYAPTVFSHCQHCEVTFGEVGLGERIRREEAAAALPPDLALEFARLSDWIRGLVERHGPGVHVEVIDAASVEGVLASVRRRVFRFPAVVVDDLAPIVGTDYTRAEPVIEQQLQRLSPASPASSAPSGTAAPSA